MAYPARSAYAYDRTYEVKSIFFPLLPTPYSLLPTPYSLLPTPYSLLPITINHYPPIATITILLLQNRIN
ncbi:hypothetical protein [Moorena sp. SIO3I6]|uniref:hypothetical protein n=1 Tax=Moorena sp. SIO3I6 TaxID=2607831 RepID=UPI0013F7C540|nr:hypothetical protein [Moorena sp. SIO3I6]NEP28918.1 hypothetical protein [Moorena sp. SIO3I6]